jgi:hypothetical protein
VLDTSGLKRARNHRLNAAAIAALAKELGDEYRNLTEPFRVAVVSAA